MQSTLQNLSNVVLPRLSDFDMFNSKRRLTTFSGWPSLSSPTPQQLVDCGFYYTGVNDGTTCFACGLYVEGWKPWDNPWLRHHRCAPDCSFLARHLATGLRTKGRTLLVEVDSVVAEAVKKEGATPVTLSKLHSILRTTDRATRMTDLKRHHASQTDFLRQQHYVEEGAAGERHIMEMVESLERYKQKTVESEKRHRKEMDEFEELYQKKMDKFKECEQREMVEFDELQRLEVNMIKWHKRQDMFPHQRHHRQKNVEERERSLENVEECIARHRLENIENRVRYLKKVGECVARHRQEKNEIVARHEKEVNALETQQKSDCAELYAEYASLNTVSIPVPNAPDLLTCSICVGVQKEVLFQPCGHFTACSVCARKFVRCPVCRGPIDYVIRVFVT